MAGCGGAMLEQPGGFHAGYQSELETAVVQPG